MTIHKRKSVSSVLLPLILSVLLVLVAACGEKTTEPKQDPSGGLTGSGTIDPSNHASFLLGSVTDSCVAPGHIEVWGSNVAFDGDSGYVTFDVQLLNRSHRTIAPPVHFVITTIIPADIALVGFDGITADQYPYKDFGAKLGADNVLSPGETSEPVMLKFHTVTARSFAIGFRIDLTGAAGPALISGVVFRDDNQNGVRDDTCATCEPGVPDITVALEKPDGAGGTMTILTRTDENGGYGFGGLAAGVYKVAVVASPLRWKVTTVNPLLITLVADGNGNVQSFADADFGLFSLVPPHPDLLFGPVLVGPVTPVGTELNSTFVNPPSPLTVVFHYFLAASEPPYGSPIRSVIDSASAWIDGVLVFAYHREEPPDTAYFGERKIELPESLLTFGEHAIRLTTYGDEHAALVWRVYRTP